MNVNIAKKNVLASLVYQVLTIIYVLIVPQIVLRSFGSEVNGLVSSLNQFLNYISLLEGGLTGVILAALYKPLAVKDYKKISGILKAANAFFRKLAVIFGVYTIVLAVVYPLVVHTSFSWGYVFSLTIIISLSIFVQYFFALSYRILINADQKGYIVYLILMLFMVVNFFFTILVVCVWNEIHVLKLLSTVAFLIQPVAFNAYVKKYYPLDKNVSPDQEAIAQRWDGFSQNIAFFIHSNTDVVVLTLVGTLTDVSIYSVYLLVINALKTLMIAISSSLAPGLGNALATLSKEKVNEVFDSYEFGISFLTVFIFTCGALLVTPFVGIYTKGIQDANYYQPLFGYLMMAAEGIYCFRDPYVNLAYISGKFRETAKYAYAECVINIGLSVVLVFRFGLIGVAIGTLVSMLYRMIAHMIYISKNIIDRPILKSLKCCVVFSCSVAISSGLVNFFIHRTANDYVTLVINAIGTSAIVMATMLLFSFFFYKNNLKKLIYALF